MYPARDIQCIKLASNWIHNEAPLWNLLGLAVLTVIIILFPMSFHVVRANWKHFVQVGLGHCRGPPTGPCSSPVHRDWWSLTVIQTEETLFIEWIQKPAQVFLSVKNLKFRWKDWDLNIWNSSNAFLFKFTKQVVRRGREMSFSLEKAPSLLY